MKKISLSILLILSLIITSITVFGEEYEPKSTYTIGYHANEKPIQYIDDTQRAAGISIDILKAVANDLDINFEFFPIIKGQDLDSINDLDMSIAITKNTLEKSKFTNETEPYFNVELELVGHTSSVSQSARRIGILDYYKIERQDIVDLIPNAEVFYYLSQEELINAFEQKVVNFIFINIEDSKPLFDYDIKKDYTIYPFLLDLPLVIMNSDEIPQNVIDSINESIRNLEQEEIAKIILKNTNTVINTNYINDINEYNNSNILKISILTILAISFIMYIIIMIYKMYLNKVTFYDKITGFLTEYKFNAEVTKVLKKAKPNEYSLVSIDIDNFHYVNEVYGFDVGTKILQKFAKYLKDCYPNGKLFSRLYSDNFLILVKNNGNQNNNIGGFNEQNFESILGEHCYFYTSEGIYNIDDPSVTLTNIVGCVNIARTSGKSTYGNTNILFTEEMNKHHLQQNQILTTMERALHEKEFEVYYQPKIILGKEKVCGAEALIRWIVRDGPPIFPDQFIPLFEKNRYITKLDFYVFEEVCYFISTHRHELEDIVISVNLSTITLLQDELVEKLKYILTKYKINVKSIELEITESAFVDNLEYILEQIKALKDVGFKIALDDFGSGISSLNQLKNIDLDVLKLDKAFLSNSLNQDKGLLIVENVIILAKKLNLKIVAEGVETKEDVVALSKLNCDIAQGYFYAHPMPKKNFLEYLENPVHDESN